MTTMTATYKPLGGDWRVARMPHECVCGDPITKGTRYCRWATKLVTGEIVVAKEADHIHADEKRAWAENYDG